MKRQPKVFNAVAHCLHFTVLLGQETPIWVLLKGEREQIVFSYDYLTLKKSLFHNSFRHSYFVRFCICEAAIR